MENKFKVIILNGRVIRERIGLTKNSRSPVAAPTSKIVWICPSEVTSERKYREMPIPIIPAMIFSINPFI